MATKKKAPKKKASAKKALPPLGWGTRVQWGRRVGSVVSDNEDGIMVLIGNRQYLVPRDELTEV